MHIAVAISNRIMAIFCCHHNCILCMILLTRMGSHAGLHNCACCLNTGLDDYMVSICVATGHIETYPKWFADKPTRTHSVNSQTGQLMKVFDGKLWLDNRSWCGFLKRIPRIRRPGAGATERFKKWYGSKFAKGRKWEWYRLFFFPADERIWGSVVSFHLGGNLTWCILTSKPDCWWENLSASCARKGRDAASIRASESSWALSVSAE